MKKRTLIVSTIMLVALISALFMGVQPVSSNNDVRVTSSGETLYYLSTATPAINVAPTALNFGNVNVGSSSTLSVTVSNIGAGDLIIGVVTSPSAPFSKTTDTCSNQTSPQGTNCTISIRFAPTAGGSFSGTFVIPTNDPTMPSYTITLTGTGISGPQIVATPNPLDFGTVNVSDTSTLTVTVRNTGSQNLVFSSITNPALPFSRVSGGTCTNTSTLTPSSTCTLRVRFAPTTENTFNGSFIINSNATNAPAYTISLTGIGRAIPMITISPNPVDFGDVINNTNTTRTVTVSSTGSKTLIVSSYTSPSAPFSIISSTCTAGINLAVGSSCTITVRFVPTTLGSHNGSFIVYSNTGDVPGTPTTVNLMGNSTAPLPTCSANFNPSTITEGQTTSLSWSTTNAVSGSYSCNGSIGSGSLPSLPNGSAMVAPTNTQTCTLTVYNSTGQSSSCSASVAVNTPLPTCSANFNPSTITEGQTTSLSWSTTNAVSGSYSCNGSIGSGSPPSLPNGSVTVAPTNTHTQTCTLTVYNSASQAATCSASVTVNPAIGGGGGVIQHLHNIGFPGNYHAVHISGNNIRYVTVNTPINATPANITFAGNWLGLSASSPSGESCSNNDLSIFTKACIIKSGATLTFRAYNKSLNSIAGGSISLGWGGYMHIFTDDTVQCYRAGLEATGNQIRTTFHRQLYCNIYPWELIDASPPAPYTP